jgi:hypothetical protein
VSGQTDAWAARRVETAAAGYDACMTENENKPRAQDGGAGDAERDLAEHERPEVGLIADEDLPEDLQPTDDNPLAKDPESSEGPEGSEDPA